MSVTVTTARNVARIILAGDLDFSSQEDLKRAAEQALAAPVEHIEIDMAETSFIDSSVIRAFLKLHESARRAQKPLTLVNCSNQIREIFQIGGFDQIFELK